MEWRASVALSLLVGAALLAGLSTTAAADEVVEIHVLSNRADLVSGGDALVEIVLPADAPPGGILVDVDGRDSTLAFDLRDGRLVGLVDGLGVGRNDLTATMTDGRGATIEITNHPRGGPLFAGPQLDPWTCDNSIYELQPATDEQCNTNVRFDFHYMSTATGTFAPYDPDEPPTDVATTTTVDGVTVPYIVRLEHGVMNRAGYQIAVLADPDRPWDPMAPQETHTGRLVIPFEGGCAHLHRSSPVGFTPDASGALKDMALRRGFAVALSSLNITDNNCNEWVSAETTVMLKEYFRENYGPIRHTMGKGCSGGATQQYHLANNYPGVLDGIIPGCSIPDAETAGQLVIDCRLLVDAFDAAPHLWAAAEQQAVVAGFPLPTPCRVAAAPDIGMDKFAYDPAHDPSCVVGLFSAETGVVTAAAEWTYDASTNPEGVRCSIPDHAAAIWGQRHEDSWGPVERALGRGFANRLFDNVGVQYGLEPLRRGELLPEQFVDLNSRIGGLDIDLQPTEERTSADPGAPAIAHRIGAINDMRSVTIPIIDIRPVGYEEFHPDVYSWSARARLDDQHGHHDNHVIWREVEPLTFGPAEAVALSVLDQWLAALGSDTREVSPRQKVVDARPAAAVDSCLAGGEVVTTGEACHTAFPPFANPRIQAGAPLATDVPKCQLRPLDRDDDYGPVAFTEEQWTRLEAAFPDGVCDWSLPSVGTEPSVEWLDFTDGPGGTPMGPAPNSTPFGPEPGQRARTELPATGGGLPALGLAGLLWARGASSRRAAR